MLFCDDVRSLISHMNTQQDVQNKNVTTCFHDNEYRHKSRGTVGGTITMLYKGSQHDLKISKLYDPQSHETVKYGHESSRTRNQE
jgi:hypothetical protein